MVTIKDKRTNQDMHSYSCKAYKESDGTCDSSPNTPDKKLPKKARKEQMNVSSEPSLAELQDNVIRVITAKINERADQTDEAVKHNTMQIEGLKKISGVLSSRSSGSKERKQHNEGESGTNAKESY